MARRSGGWKTKLRVSDLDDDAKLEAVCVRCDHVRYLTKSGLTDAGKSQSYIDEIEQGEICTVLGCGGKVRLAMMHKNATSGFVGGLA